MCYIKCMGSYKKNQKTEYTQGTDGPFRKITGFWKRSKTGKNGKEMVYFKSGRMNMAGFENMQAFGEDTEFLILPYRKSSRTGRSPNGPDYYMIAVKAYGEQQEDVYWDENK